MIRVEDTHPPPLQAEQTPHLSPAPHPVDEQHLFNKKYTMHRYMI